MQMAWLSCVHRAVVAGQSSGEFPQRDWAVDEGQEDRNQRSR
jgi:hypothetical protein